MTFFNDFFKEIIDIFKPYCKYIKFSFVIILFFLSSIFQIIPITLFNLDINSISNNSKALLILFSNTISLIIILSLYWKSIKRDLKKLIKYKKDKLSIIYDHSFRYWLIGLIIMFISTFIIEKLGISAASNDLNVRTGLEASPILYGISVFFIVPIIEELVFRLSFKNIFKKKWIYVLVSGLIFGSIHVIFSLSDLYQLFYLVPYCSLGIAFAYLYYEADNIFVPISFHIFHNVLTAFITFLLAGALI